MKRQIVTAMMIVVAGVMLVSGCNKAPEYGYTSDGRPAKPLRKGELPKIEPGQERNMMNYLYKGKK